MKFIFVGAIVVATAVAASWLFLASCGRATEEQKKPLFPFPVRLGDDIRTVRSQIQAHFGSDEAAVSAPPASTGD